MLTVPCGRADGVGASSCEHAVKNKILQSKAPAMLDDFTKVFIMCNVLNNVNNLEYFILRHKIRILPSLSQYLKNGIEKYWYV